MRESGFYWVLFGGKLRIAEWEGGLEDWWLSGTDGWFFDDEFDKIDERRIAREVE